MSDEATLPPKLAVIGTVRVPPEAIEAARPAMAAMLEATRAEPGCVSYSYAEDVIDPGLVRVAELWRSQADLDAHFATPHMAVWREALGKVGILSRDLMVYEISGGRPT